MMVTTVERVQKIWDMIGGEEVVDALINGRAKLEIKFIQKLNHQGIITIPATTEKFLANEKFLAKEKFYQNSKEVKFYAIWDYFTKWFLEGDIKTEEIFEEQTLSYSNLVERSIDRKIIEELDGKFKAETTLSEVYYLLKNQASGEYGPLLTNGYPNVFYVHDVSGYLRAVNVDWIADGWCVRANDINFWSGWPVGSRFFFHNF